VLLDLCLPDGHGLDLVRGTLVTKDHQRPDFLVITAARDMASVRAAMQLGTVHYVVKPSSFVQLEERKNAYRDMRGRLERILTRIRELLQGSSADVSATDIAAQVGISRSTAQRYLAELARQGKVELHLHYGAAGHPEHRCRLTTPAN
jgi:response regulator of citrate/malate metabolism